MTTTTETYRTADCQSCGQTHEAEYHHDGRFGEGPIYIVICTADGLADYYTEEGLNPTPVARPALGLTF